MKFYESYLLSKNIKVVYIDSFNGLSDIRNLIPYLKTKGVNSFQYTDTTDCWLEQRINKTSGAHQIDIMKHPTPLFLNTSDEITSYFSKKNKMFQDSMECKEIIIEKFERQKLNFIHRYTV